MGKEQHSATLIIYGTPRLKERLLDQPRPQARFPPFPREKHRAEEPYLSLKYCQDIYVTYS